VGELPEASEAPLLRIGGNTTYLCFKKMRPKPQLNFLFWDSVGMRSSRLAGWMEVCLAFLLGNLVGAVHQGPLASMPLRGESLYLL
jgi:hypothetical protein